MQIEEILGQYQLHLIAHELPGGGKWDPFVAVFKFDEKLQDFVCVYEMQRASDKPLSNYDEAIEAARRAGNALLKQGTC